MLPVPSNPFRQPPAALLEHEFAQEKASALGRLGRALEAALQALAEFDAARPRNGAVEASAADRRARASLVVEAGVALWHFVVQREACGLRDLRQVVRDYRVPPEVAARMGVMPEKATRPRR
jgi:hypothetical protein